MTPPSLASPSGWHGQAGTPRLVSMDDAVPSRAYLLELQQEGDVVALLGREPPVGREDAQPLGRFARALLGLGRVPLPHPVRAVVGNNLPVSVKGWGNWEKVLLR